MKRRKLSLILAAILLIALAAILFFGFSYLGWGFGPQLTDIEVGMTHEEILELLPGVDFPENYSDIKTPGFTCAVIYRYGSQIAYATFYSSSAQAPMRLVDCFVFNRLRQSLGSLVSDRYRLTQKASAAMASEDFSRISLFELDDRYGSGTLNHSNFAFTQHIMLNDGRRLSLYGVTAMLPVSSPTIPDQWLDLRDEQNRAPWHNAYFHRVELLDIFAYDGSADWLDQANTLLYESTFDEADRLGKVYMKDFFLRRGLDYPITD